MFAVLALSVAAVAAVSARRVPTVTLTVSRAGDSLPNAPTMVVKSAGVTEDQRPVTLMIEVAMDPQFAAIIYSALLSADSTTFVTPRLFPERTALWFRARLLDRLGNVIAEDSRTRGVTRSWFYLVAPDGPTNVVIFTRRPTFVWSATPVSTPPGPWAFDLTVTNTATQQAEFEILGLTDTSYTLPIELELNTSYRWQVVARLVNSSIGQTLSHTSRSSFVATAPPRATLFYHPFPNPFPDPSSGLACFWFDLARDSDVRLTIHDIRLRHVRTILPRGASSPRLQAGIYGRNASPTQTGCDTRFAWDGTDDRGATVPPGVYLARFTANGTTDIKKILFLGR